MEAKLSLCTFNNRSLHKATTIRVNKTELTYFVPFWSCGSKPPLFKSLARVMDGEKKATSNSPSSRNGLSVTRHFKMTNISLLNVRNIGYSVP